MALRSHRGNILFLILLAVVLFAALAYAVTQSMRGGGKDGGAERNTLLASQILQYATLMENTVTRARLMNDVPDHGFDFSGPSSASTANATCASAACRVFDTSARSGLMTSAPTPKAAYLSGAGLNYFYISNVKNVGTAAEDVSFFLLSLTPEVCKAINAQLGLNVDLSIPDDFGGTPTLYSGTMTSLPVAGSEIGEMGNGLIGSSSGCYYHSSGTYRFYHVLIAR